MKPRHFAFASGCLLFASIGCERKKTSSVAESMASNQAERSSPSPPTVESQPPVAPDRRSRLNAAAMKAMLKKNAFDDPSDGYFQGFLKVGSAEKTNNREDSIRLLQVALSYFQEVKNRFPDWKPEMVSARIKKTQETLTKLSLPDHESK